MFHKTTLRGLMVVIFLVASVSPVVRASTIFDVANDFSIASNPNGDWSYGYSTTLTGPLILNNQSLSSDGTDMWYTNISLDNPNAIHNTTQQIITSGTDQLQPGQFVFHPGPNDEYEKARLTVPTAGNYLITGAFSGASLIRTTTDVHILLNGVPVFDGTVNGFGPTSGPTFSLMEPLAVNDILDFAVGDGGNGFDNDLTGLAAQIGPYRSPNPPPSRSWARHCWELG